MENYWLIWIVYSAAAAAFYWVYWRITTLPRARWLSYSLRALMFALMMTPWYANTDGDTMAPALMVVTLDAITIGLNAATRALVPLVLSLILAEILATLFYLVTRNRKKA